MSADGPISDGEMERMVVIHVLDEHPAVLRVKDLILELSPSSPGEFADDQIRRAVGELIGKGLLWVDVEFSDGAGVRPTPAALHFEAINQL